MREEWELGTPARDDFATSLVSSSAKGCTALLPSAVQPFLRALIELTRPAGLAVALLRIGAFRAMRCAAAGQSTRAGTA